MQLIKEEKGHKIYKKRSGRYAVSDGKGKFINGQQKVDILNAAGVIKVNPPKPKETSEEPAAEAPAESTTEETDDKPSE